MGRKSARRLKAGSVIILFGHQEIVEKIVVDGERYVITCQQGPTIIRSGGAKIETP